MIALLLTAAVLAQDFDDLEAAAVEGLAVLTVCSEAPGTCGEEELSDALYSVILRDHVYQEDPDPGWVAALEAMDPERFALLPEVVREIAGDLPAWLSSPVVTPPAQPQVRLEIAFYELARGHRKVDRELGDPAHGILVPARGRDVHAHGEVLVRPTMLVKLGERAQFIASNDDGLLSFGVEARRSYGAWQLTVDLELPGPEAGLSQREIQTTDSQVFLRRQEDGRQWLVAIEMSLVEEGA